MVLEGMRMFAGYHENQSQTHSLIDISPYSELQSPCSNHILR